MTIRYCLVLATFGFGFVQASACSGKVLISGDGSSGAATAAGGESAAVAMPTVGVAGGAPLAIAGAGNGTAGGSSSVAGSSGDLPAGIPILPTDGWVGAASNPLGIQGAIFSAADPITVQSVTDTISTGLDCIQGTAAKVTPSCTVVAPATDCFGTIWGALMALNLNQPIGGEALWFDGSRAGITGFAFDISGPLIPAVNFRFFINDTAGNQYCSRKAITTGPNVFMLKDLIQECWMPPNAADMTGETAVNNIVKIAWEVGTNSSSAVPFNFCVDNIEVLKTN